MQRRDFQVFLSLFKLAIRAAPFDALKSLAWMVQRKRVRGWNCLHRAASVHPDFYENWIRIAEPHRVEDFLKKGSAFDPKGMGVLLLADSESGFDDTERSIQSVRVALGEHVRIYSVHQFEGCVTLGADTLKDAFLAIARDDIIWLLPVSAGDLLSPHLGKALGTIPPEDRVPVITYWDEDVIVEGRRADPWIKPDWDELLFLKRDFISGAAIIPMECALAEVDGVDDDGATPLAIAQLMLRIAGRQEQQPHHLPLILTHRKIGSGFATAAQRCSAIGKNWPMKLDCVPSSSAGVFAVVRPHEPLQWPSVSILIPTKDRGALLDACVNSLTLLRYDGPLEIIIIDNGSSEPHACALLDRLAKDGIAQVISAPGPFNFSKLNNVAAKQSSGDFLCLLNNDVEAEDGQWLSQMIRHAIVESVGAVGALLLYPDRSIQHAGVAIGIGQAAGHIEQGKQEDEPGHLGFRATREVSAVTAACMVVRKSNYAAVGGLDEDDFPVAFNDVDFCLRLKSRGLRNMFVAEARLIHHESASRGSDFDAANANRFQKELTALKARWRTEGFQDPHFSPLFSTTSGQCILAL